MKKRKPFMKNTLVKSRIKNISRQNLVKYEPTMLDEEVDDQLLFELIHDLEKMIDSEFHELNTYEKKLIEDIKKTLSDFDYDYLYDFDNEPRVIKVKINKRPDSVITIFLSDDVIQIKEAYPFEFDKTRIAAVALKVAEINSNEFMNEKFILNFDRFTVSIQNKFKVFEFDQIDFTENIESLISSYNKYFDDFKELSDVKEGEVPSFHQALINVGSNIFFRGEKIVKYKPNRINNFLSKNVGLERNQKKPKHIDMVDLSSNDDYCSMD